MTQIKSSTGSDPIQTTDRADLLKALQKEAVQSDESLTKQEDKSEIYAVMADFSSIEETEKIAAAIDSQNLRGMINTNAGSIDFAFIAAIRVFSSLFHRLAAVFPENNSFELLNGSKWVTSNIEMVKGWMGNDQLLITQNQAFFSTHRFALLNPRLQKAIPMSLLREPRPSERESIFILKLDLANDVITLNNGQEWSAYSHDHGTLRKFSEHDRILIGVNTSDIFLQEKKMPYILIDSASSLYVRANSIN